ncbi:hypothetical protein F383_24044 [Gossypium arboreum]|uniref:Receptor-like serine/threonine-protein kinase n=1 Tax=Gossypium arboreum TaxID=29729 RepID=A0A0B0MPV8_GOSAR|nr:hypothetical protein F383_24044 [Gossypium arboreum]
MYLGIRMKNVPTKDIVWIANRDLPFSGSSMILTINEDGYLVIVNGRTSYRVSDDPLSSQNVSATLLDSGNLVLRDGNMDIPWQSFDYPSNTFLPGMKLGYNNKTGKVWSLTSWLDEEDPNNGEFELKMDPKKSNGVFLMKGTETLWSSGAWTGKGFTLTPEMRLNYIFNYTMYSDENQTYFSYSLYNSSIITRFIIDIDGHMREFVWLESSQQWGLFWSQPRQFCDILNSCGPFSCCNEDTGSCQCLPGFYPSEKQQGQDGGCMRTKDPNGGTIFIKLAASEIDNDKGDREDPSLDILLFDMEMSITTSSSDFSGSENSRKRKRKDSPFPLFSFDSVSLATDNFSSENKLGEGGFGPVYKGKLLNGQEIAVKRLSKRSGQGLEELKNETMLIAKLQHRNLVRLLGCCLEQGEKILIYEFMPNKSLDSFLFGSDNQGLLDWGTRVRIIEGIAQGLLYLHQYSRLRIIHRDLKASNILLDGEMNPKISDFGLARMFGGDNGYMSPEYAMEGLFSIKSDVFSFGVLLLEIVSGKKSTGFYHSSFLNLIGHAWELWKGDRVFELMDPKLEDQVSYPMVYRYINVALLCVQEMAADRPTMSEVVSMLTNELTVLNSPKKPAFSNARSTTNSSNQPEKFSVNDVTVYNIRVSAIDTLFQGQNMKASVATGDLRFSGSSMILTISGVEYLVIVSGRTTYRSSDYPSNTFLPGMNLGYGFYPAEKQQGQDGRCMSSVPLTRGNGDNQDRLSRMNDASYPLKFDSANQFIISLPLGASSFDELQCESMQRSLLV